MFREQSFFFTRYQQDQLCLWCFKTPWCTGGADGKEHPAGGLHCHRPTFTGWSLCPGGLLCTVFEQRDGGLRSTLERVQPSAFTVSHPPTCSCEPGQHTHAWDTGGHSLHTHRTSITLPVCMLLIICVHTATIQYTRCLPTYRYRHAQLLPRLDLRQEINV